MTAPVLTPDAELNPSQQTGVRRGAVHRFLRNPAGIGALGVLLLITVLGLIAPLISGDPNHGDLRMVNAPAGTPGYPLGGDSSGRDILSLLLASIDSAMSSALIGMGIAVIIGIVAGLIAGYFGKSLDDGMSWVFNLLMTFPAVILLIVLFPVTGGSYPITMAIYGVLIAPGIFWLVRNIVVGVRNELYVDAARVAGVSDSRILFRHIFAVVRGPVIVSAAFLAGACINLQTGLAFLGLGSSSDPNWGQMISAGFTNFYSAPFQFVWPSLALGITTTAFVLLGNACRDALANTAKQTRRRTATTRRPPDLMRAEPIPGQTLDIRGLSVSYPGIDGELRSVVRDITLTVAPGEVLGLVGESGSGKTQTAFAALSLLPREAVMTGSIFINGTDTSALSPKQLREFRTSNMAYVPQEPMSNLDPTSSIGHQLVAGIRASLSVSRRQAKTQALALLRRVGIQDAERIFRSYPHEISGGMAQRVLIAGAVASKPALLIADEPTTALDVTVQAEILDLLRDLQSELGMAVLIVTHNFGVVADICDRVVVMSGGAVVESGTTDAILSHPREQYTRMLLESIPDDSLLRDPAPVAAPLLEIKELRVSFPGRGAFAKPTEILHGVNLHLSAGETLGLVGESGSGKTTIGRSVLGLVTPASGQVLMNGLPRSAEDRRKPASEVQVVFQDPYTSLNPALTIGETLSEPLVAQGATKSDARDAVAHVLELVNLPADSLQRLPREFSGGQRQRVAIARALALSPRLIVCDEPVSALDLSNQARVLDLFIELQERTGVAYLFISHDLAVIRRVSHRVAVIYRGEIVETGPVDQVTGHPQHPYTSRLLMSSPVIDQNEQRRRREQLKSLAAAGADD